MDGPGISQNFRRFSRFTRIYRNNHDNTFTDIREALTSVSSGVAAWGDFDGDRDLDVLYCGTGKGPETFLYRNLSRAFNTLPSAPTGLAVQSDQTLAWDAAADAESIDGAGLTYNLRIGTTPGASDVMAPHTDTLTGVCRVAAPGNVGPSDRWRVNLPPGIYYWSVQSVDAALVGSPFATERVLAIPVVASAAQVTIGRPIVGLLELRVTGVPHERYRIEVSEDLTNWNELATEQASSNGLIVLTVPFTNPGQRFFQARLAP